MSRARLRGLLFPLQEEQCPAYDPRRKEVLDDAMASARTSFGRVDEIAGRIRQLTHLDRAEQQRVDVNEICSETIAFLKAELARARRSASKRSSIQTSKSWTDVLRRRTGGCSYLGVSWQSTAAVSSSTARREKEQPPR